MNLKNFISLNETATAEFYTIRIEPSGEIATMVKFNGKKMTLQDFTKKAKGDTNAALILGAVKHKAEKEGLSGSNLLYFIRNFLKYDDEKLDVVVKDGVEKVEKGQVVKASPKPSFDEKEIRRGWKERKEKGGTTPASQKKIVKKNGKPDITDYNAKFWRELGLNKEKGGKWHSKVLN